MASARPASATSSGTSPMLTTLVQNCSASDSTRRFLRSSFRSRRVSIAFLRKFSSSACCSGVRMVLTAPPRDFCSACSFSWVWLSVSSSSLILPRYCCCACDSISWITVSGRLKEARLLRLMSALSPENCSTRPCASARLPLRGTMTFWPKTSCTSTAAPSASMSASATSTTEFSAADCLSCGSALASAFLSSDFFSSPFFPRGMPNGSGLPSGKAVWNLPVRRIASGSSSPEGWKPRVEGSPESVAMMRSTGIEFLEACASTVWVRPSAGLPLNEPPNGIKSVPTWLVTTSSMLSACWLSESSVGSSRGPAPLAKVRSATTLPMSTSMPHALNSR